MSELNSSEPLKADTMVIAVDFEVDAVLIARLLKDNQRIDGAAITRAGERWGVFIPHADGITERLPSLMAYCSGALDAIQRTMGRVVEMKGG